MKICALAAALMLVLQAGSSAATTIHYWQFEDSPGYLEDSVGSATLIASGANQQAALPGSGRGSSFDSVVPGTVSALDNGVYGRLTTPIFALGDFTVEALAHADSLPGSFGNTLATAGDTQNNISIAWLFQVRNAQLSMAFCNLYTCELVFSGLSVVAGKDYYAAAAVDQDGGQTTFYLKNLSDGGPLQTASKTHTTTTLNSPSNFAIGGMGDGSLYFDGLIDEVRISDIVLSEQQLLVVPEPSVASLLATGLACLAGLRRRTPR